MKLDWNRTAHNPTHPDSTGHHTPRLLPADCKVDITEFGDNRQHFLSASRLLHGDAGSLHIHLWHRDVAYLRNVAEVLVDDDLLPYLGEAIKVVPPAATEDAKPASSFAATQEIAR